MSSRHPLRLSAISVAVMHALSTVPVTALAAPPPGATAANNDTQVNLAPNGVPVVNIANPNASGLSHNRYTEFNVDSRGLVLNNGTPDQVTRQSQLAGQVLANVNLTSAATVILNEVVTPNRSQLNGYTEVLGGKADVIVANPFGITCNGCGFINSDRVSLTTGTPNFDGTALTGFTVNGGDVLVSGAGLNAGNQSYFDIVTRAAKVDGQINAHSLNIATGANTWDYASGLAERSDGSTAIAGYAFDSTALGGIYADRIRIISTEAGVGVRVLGDVAATAEDFNLTTAGKIELRSRLSAQRDLAVNYAGEAGGSAGGITVAGAGTSLSAGSNLQLNAGLGDLALTDGALKANETLFVGGASLVDSSSSSAVRFGKNVFLQFSGDADIAGTSWGAGSIFQAQLASLTLHGEQTALYSGAADSVLGVLASGDIELGSASVKSLGAMSLISSDGDIHVGAGSKGVQAGNLFLSTRRLANEGNVLSDGVLMVQGATPDASVEIANSGLLQAGSALALGSPTGLATVNNTASGVILGDSLSITASDVINAGRIQSAHGGSIRAASLANTTLDAAILTSTAGDGGGLLNISGALANAGTIRDGALLAVNTGSLTNAAGASISAAGAVAVAGTAVLTNDGTLAGGTNLSVAAADIFNNGSLQAAGQLSASSGQLTNTGKMLGDTLSISADNFANSGGVQSVHGGTIAVATLGNTGAAAKLLLSTDASGHAALNVSGALTNNALIHSVGDLNVVAGSLTNSGTAGLSSLGTLSLDTQGNLDNAGLLFAGTQMNVAMGGTFSNSSSVMAGAPASGIGGLSVVGNVFRNTGNVLAEGNINFDVRAFHNNPVGGLPVVEDLARVAVLLEDNPTSDCLAFTFGICTSFSAPYRHVNFFANQIGDSGDFDCDLFDSHCYHSRAYEAVYTQDQRVVGGMPTPAQILAAGNISIFYRDEAHNVASIISANNVAITGDAGAAAFENKDFHLEHREYRQRYAELAHSGDRYFIPLTEWEYQLTSGELQQDHIEWARGWTEVANRGEIERNSYMYLASSIDIPNTNAGIFALGNFTYIGPGLVNKSGTTPASHVTGTAPTPPTSLIGSPAVLPAPTSSSGLDLSLPGNPNGFFVPSRDPASRYLIETNPLFTTGTALGSDYLARLLGYDADTLQRRLGDANYEDRLIREQLIAQTGRNILLGYSNEQEQVKDLMESAAAQSGALGLVYGKALTPGQAAALNHDIVWMEEKSVGGQKVLVPVVYLSSRTRESVSSGAVINASNISIKGGSLTNTGGTIEAGSNLSVETAGDIRNTSGTIGGGTVNLKSTGGDIVNETVATHRGNEAVGSTDIGKTATITARDGLTVDAAKDVVVSGGEVRSGGDATIGAGRNVVIDTIEDRSASSTASSSSGLMYGHSTNTNTQSVTQIGSKVETGGNVSIRAGNDVTVGGSQVTAGGDASVSAGRDVNIVDRQSTTSTTTRTESHGQASDGLNVGFESASTDVHSETGTSVGSGIKSGGSTKIDASRTVNMRGSDIDAGGNLDITGKDINVVAGQNTTLDTRHEESSSTMVGVRADADSTGWDATHTDASSNESTATSTARSSTLKAGGNINRSASGKITDVGTQIEAGGDFSQSAKTIDSRAAENTQTTTKDSSVEKISVGQSIDYGAGTAVEDAQNGSTAGAVAASGGPTAGSNIKYSKDTSNSSESASQAVVSSIKAGGKVSSSSSGGTTLEGTQIQGGGDVDISARDLNVKAAKDTTSSSSSSEHVDAAFRGEVDVSGKPGATVSGGYGNTDAQAQSSTAVVGGIKSGGNVTVRTKGDTRLEGTNIESKGDTTIDAGGNVKMDAARSTSSSESSDMSVSGSVSVSKGGGGFSAKGSGGESEANASEAVTGSVKSGGNLTVRSGKDVQVEGADLSAGKNATVDAGGKVEMKDAVSTSESSSWHAEASVAASGSKGSGGKGGGKGGSKSEGIAGAGGTGSSEQSSTVTKKKTTVKAGEEVNVQSKEGTTLNGTEVTSGAARKPTPK